VIVIACNYGCGTQSFTLREEHRLRVLENRVRTSRFGPKREEGWRRLYNEELHELYSLPNMKVKKARRMGCVGHAVCMG
jgi:hypothetical protein